MLDDTALPQDRRGARYQIPVGKETSFDEAWTRTLTMTDSKQRYEKMGSQDLKIFATYLAPNGVFHSKGGISGYINHIVVFFF